MRRVAPRLAGLRTDLPGATLVYHVFGAVQVAHAKAVREALRLRQHVDLRGLRPGTDVLDVLPGHAVQGELRGPVRPSGGQWPRRLVALRRVLHPTAVVRSVLPVLAADVRVAHLLAGLYGIGLDLEVTPLVAEGLCQSHDLPAGEVPQDPDVAVHQTLSPDRREGVTHEAVVAYALVAAELAGLPGGAEGVLLAVRVAARKGVGKLHQAPALAGPGLLGVLEDCHLATAHVATRGVPGPAL
mmetsp:Transcript_90332/g.292370  ORF Transcript_90332/g.292370 Transcript_90332/m.292370 type:complete len:242 (-) Transcript_90332:512-1237(-)